MTRYRAFLLNDGVPVAKVIGTFPEIEAEFMRLYEDMPRLHLRLYLEVRD